MWTCYPDAPFPVERLVVASGKLSASAHKNAHNPLHGVQCQPDKQKLMHVAGKLFDVSAFAPPKQVPDLYGQGTLNLHFDPKPLTRA